MGVPYAEVIGDPISHSKSPPIHNFWLEKLGIRSATIAPLECTPSQLGDYFAARRADKDWRGCNVTMPHKEAVLDHVDELDEHADEVAASNCVLGFRGRPDRHQYRQLGLDEFYARDPRFRKRPIVVIGSGGAARAVLAAAAGLGVDRVTIVARNSTTAHEIAQGEPPQRIIDTDRRAIRFSEGQTAHQCHSAGYERPSAILHPFDFEP